MALIFLQIFSMTAMVFILNSGLVTANKSANQQCVEKTLPGKTLSDVKWSNVQTEAFVKDNREYQCFILCGLSNLNILKSTGAVETTNNPLESELGDVIKTCAQETPSDDACKTAKRSALCLFAKAGRLTDEAGVGKIIKDVNENFKKSGKTIVWQKQ
uniref:Uncharacterized protein n=1 Tax=Culicoides sonorensis TaxID=179676 RepID=Q66U03_CULSO|nr:unknown salivary protein [Culicoides sonorensis]